MKCIVIKVGELQPNGTYEYHYKIYERGKSSFLKMFFTEQEAMDFVKLLEMDKPEKTEEIIYES
jgi:hypothetical protein